jgi:hypothetical protein
MLDRIPEDEILEYRGSTCCIAEDCILEYRESEDRISEDYILVMDYVNYELHEPHKKGTTKEIILAYVLCFVMVYTIIALLVAVVMLLMIFIR